MSVVSAPAKMAEDDWMASSKGSAWRRDNGVVVVVDDDSCGSLVLILLLDDM